MAKVKLKCEICLKYSDEHVVYEYIVENFLMLERVCLSCLFQVKKERGGLKKTLPVKIEK